MLTTTTKSPAALAVVPRASRRSSEPASRPLATVASETTLETSDTAGGMVPLCDRLPLLPGCGTDDLSDDDDRSTVAWPYDESPSRDDAGVSFTMGIMTSSSPSSVVSAAFGAENAQDAAPRGPRLTTWPQRTPLITVGMSLPPRQRSQSMDAALTIASLAAAAAAAGFSAAQESRPFGSATHTRRASAGSPCLDVSGSSTVVDESEFPTSDANKRIRRARNRVSQAQSRARKKLWIDWMETQCKELSAKNAELQQRAVKLRSELDGSQARVQLLEAHMAKCGVEPPS